MSTWRGLKLVEKIGGYSWTPTEGLVVRPRYEGDKASVMKIAAQLRNAGIAHDVDIDGPIASVEAISMPAGAEDDVTGFWELAGQQESVDIREHPRFKALTDAEKFVINQLIDGVAKFPPSDTWRYQETENGQQITINPSDDAQEFYRLAYNGQMNYFRTGRVLRHTLIISQARQAAISLGNADRIYTTQQVISEGNQYDDPIPVVIQNEMQLLEPNGPVPPNHIFGWLKQSPVIRTTTGWKLEVSVEYVLEMWPTLLYSPL